MAWPEDDMHRLRRDDHQDRSLDYKRILQGMLRETPRETLTPDMVTFGYSVPRKYM